MITMNELVDLRMQQHIAHEIYRQQIMQRIPDPFPPMLPIPMPRHVIMPPRVTLPGVEVTLQNDELWKQFHQIGTEMIITKSGRRMFPSMRLTLSGLEEETNYCVLLEMVPIGDCRYKFSGSQWVPAGGAEPQSPQRMFLHPDSPASGSHWQAQPILFNKVKLTNNTLDNNGHVVLASMHKYQPRIHVIRTSDLTQIPWAPQQAFVFTETEFVAVTAYQNDRITKLKIDNNPFAKGFRETGQSRCKRKMSSSLSDEDQDQHAQQPQQSSDMSPTKFLTTGTTDSGSPICSDKATQRSTDDSPQIKRLRSNGSACSQSSLNETAQTPSAACHANAVSGFSLGSAASETCSSSPKGMLELHGGAPPLSLSLPLPLPAQTNAVYTPANSGVCTGATSVFMHNLQQNMQTLLRPSLVDLACSYFGRPQPIYAQHMYAPPQQAVLVAGRHGVGNVGNVGNVGDVAAAMQLQEHLPLPAMELPHHTDNSFLTTDHSSNASQELDIVSDSSSQADLLQLNPDEASMAISVDGLAVAAENVSESPTPKRKGFSISAILGGSS